MGRKGKGVRGGTGYVFGWLLWIGLDDWDGCKKGRKEKRSFSIYAILVLRFPCGRDRTRQQWIGIQPRRAKDSQRHQYLNLTSIRSTLYAPRR